MNLFTYDTLMDPGVFSRISGRSRPRLPARVTGYRAVALAGTSYLAAVPDPAAELVGIVCQGSSTSD